MAESQEKQKAGMSHQAYLAKGPAPAGPLIYPEDQCLKRKQESFEIRTYAAAKKVFSNQK